MEILGNAYVTQIKILRKQKKKSILHTLGSQLVSRNRIGNWTQPTVSTEYLNSPPAYEKVLVRSKHTEKLANVKIYQIRDKRY